MGGHNFKGTANVIFSIIFLWKSCDFRRNIMIHPWLQGCIAIFPWTSLDSQSKKKNQCKHVSTLHVPYTLQRQAEESSTGRCSSIGKWLFLYHACCYKHQWVIFRHDLHLSLTIAGVSNRASTGTFLLTMHWEAAEIVTVLELRSVWTCAPWMAAQLALRGNVITS